MAGWIIVQIDPRVLVYERESIWFTQIQLASKIWITPVALSRIENTGRLYEYNLNRVINIFNTPIKRGQFITKRITNLTIKDLQIYNK